MFSQRVNVPVGPSGPSSATRTTSRDPSSLCGANRGEVERERRLGADAVGWPHRGDQTRPGYRWHARWFRGFCRPTTRRLAHQPFAGPVLAERITGKVTDDGFSLEIDWVGASVGSYEARIDQEGNIFDGVGRDILNPNNRVSFTANRRVSPQEEAPYEEGPRDGTRLGSPAVGIDPPPRCGSTFVRPDLMATVISDVDLYDVPGGVGEVIGMLVECSRNGPFIRGCDAPMVVKRRRECCPRSLWG